MQKNGENYSIKVHRRRITRISARAKPNGTPQTTLNVHDKISSFSHNSATFHSQKQCPCCIYQPVLVQHSDVSSHHSSALQNQQYDAPKPKFSLILLWWNQLTSVLHTSCCLSCGSALYLGNVDCSKKHPLTLHTHSFSSSLKKKNDVQSLLGANQRAKRAPSVTRLASEAS